MKRFFGMISLMAVIMMMVACGGKEHKYVGKFTDKFGNHFELREDYTGTIAFVGMEDKQFNITWSDGDDHKRPYATIEFNGDPEYYFLRDGVLYGSRQHMDEGRGEIQITWED